MCKKSWQYLVVDPIVFAPCGISIGSETVGLSFSQGDGEHKLEPNLEPNCDVDVEDNSSLTRIFSPLISVIWVTIESGSPSILNVESRSGDDGERLLVGVAHLLFGGVKVSWSPKGEDVAIPPNPRGDGDRLKYDNRLHDTDLFKTPERYYWNIQMLLNTECA